MSNSNPYGYSGGRIRNPGEIYNVKHTEGLSAKQIVELERQNKIREAKHRNFDKRFRGPIFKVDKKATWYSRLLDTAFRRPTSPFYWGCFLTFLAWGPVVYQIFEHKETPEEGRDRDILIRKAFDNFGDRWWSFAMPYNWRYKQILQEDYQNEQRKRKEGQE